MQSTRITRIADKAQSTLAPSSEEPTCLSGREAVSPNEVGSPETHRILSATPKSLDRNQREADQEILTRALAQTSEAILILDKELRISFANEAFCRQVGYAAEELVGNSVTMVGPPPIPGMPSEPVAFEAWIRERGSASGVAAMPTKNGMTFSAYLTISPVLDAQGNIIAYVETHADLRPIKQSEANLRESEEKFLAISTAAQDAMLVLDDAGRISFWNEAASRIFGYPAEEALGQNVHLLLAPARYHDDHAAGWSRFAKDGKSPVGKVLELESRRKDGTEFFIELSISPVRLRGHWNVVCIARDITERKKAEKSLRRINRALRTIGACNMVLVHAMQEQQLLTDMCQTVVEHSGYRLAWIGFVEHDEDESLRPVASVGCEADWTTSERMSWADNDDDVMAAGRDPLMGKTRTCACALSAT